MTKEGSREASTKELMVFEVPSMFVEKEVEADIVGTSYPRNISLNFVCNFATEQACNIATSDGHQAGQTALIPSDRGTLCP